MACHGAVDDPALLRATPDDRLWLEALVLEERQLEAIDALLELEGDRITEEVA